MLKIDRYEDIEDLPDGVFFTNSERTSLSCLRKYFFQYIEGLREDQNEPMRFGSAYHKVMESLWLSKMNGETIDWESTLFEVCGEFGVEQTGLHYLIDGYLRTYPNIVPDGYRIIAVEKAFYRETGHSGEFHLVEDNGNIRLGRAGEAHFNVCEVSKLPMYQVGRLDAVIEHIETGSIYGWDHKTSARPSKFKDGTLVDPQGQGYFWLLSGAYGAGRVKGFVYDIAMRGLAKPKVLKNGSLSKAKNRKIPSWLYEDSIRELGLDKADYAAHINALKKSDDEFFVRDWVAMGYRDRVNYSAEIRGIARMIQRLRFAACNAKTEADVVENFPRTPICRYGNGCAFRSPCIEDGDAVRARYKTQTTQIWVNKREQERGELYAGF